jgi:2-polyprenyl-3-methyl-5-hydroxy-6-metoxy-1,4-benzoquinol methylase
VSAIGRGVARRALAAVDALIGRVDSPTRPPPAEAESPGVSGWWDLLPFTTHRITLAPGIETARVGVDALHDVRTELVLDACGGSLEGKSVVDLGCLEGGFTLAFAQRGARLALGIEAREVSVRRCELARDLLGLDAAEFVRADIKDELARRDVFDVVFAAGILYHLADPAAFLRTMRSACRGVALIDTHVADPDRSTHGCSEVVTRSSGERTYRGRMFPEYAPDVAEDVKDDLLWAAWSDTDSFWPLEEDLEVMMLDAGFGSFEKVDLAADGRASRWGVDQTNRVVYLARV